MNATRRERLKTQKGDRRAKYEESEKERGTREAPHVDISYIRRNNRFVAMLLFQLSLFCIKLSNDVCLFLSFLPRFQVEYHFPLHLLDLCY